MEEEMPAAPAPAPAPEPPSAPALTMIDERTARRRAGVSFLMAAAGGIGGAIVGGAWGAGAGVLFMGALRNGWRAQTGWGSGDEATRNEAAKSATMAAIGVAAGGFLAYQAYKARED